MANFKLHKDSRRLRGTIFYIPDFNKQGLFWDVFNPIIPKRSVIKSIRLHGEDQNRYDMVMCSETYFGYWSSYSWKSFRITSDLSMPDKGIVYGYIRFRDR